MASANHDFDIACFVGCDVTGLLGAPQGVHRSELIGVQLPADGASALEHRGEALGVHRVVVPLIDHAVAAVPVAGRWDGNRLGVTASVPPFSAHGVAPAGNNRVEQATGTAILQQGTSRDVLW